MKQFFKKGDKFQVLSKYGPPYIIGEIKEIYLHYYTIKEDKCYLSPHIKSTNNVLYSLDQIKKINL